MKASGTLIGKIKEFEGFRSKAYRATPSEKYLTIGYGHYGADVKQHMTITRDAATELLRKDLVRFEKYVTGLNVARSQFEFDALVDFCYNLGTDALEGSTLLKKIRAAHSTTVETAAHKEDIKKEFMKWVYAEGKKLAGLVRRREWEAERFFTKRDK